MDTRVGYPNEHLAGDSDDAITSPLFATAVGLVMDGLKRQERVKAEAIEEEIIENEVEENDEVVIENTVAEQPKKQKRSFLDSLTERVKDFLDNAE